MVMDILPDNKKSVARAVIVNVFFICIHFWNFQSVVSASCILTDGQLGECIKLEECRSAVILSQKGVNPGFCSIEEGTVCCTDYKSSASAHRRPLSNIQDVPFASSRKWSAQTSSQVTSDGNPKETFEEDLHSQRKKHSVGLEISENSHGRRKTNSDIIGEPYKFETPNTFYSGSEIANKPVRRPSRPKLDQSEDNYFVPPGQAKKKPWRDEKTTENYYFEHVTKKPSRGPNRKGSNKHTESNNEPNNSRKWGNINTTRRPELPEQGKKTTNSWHNGQNDHENSYSNERTTKRNNWGQESYITTRRPDYFGGENEFGGNGDEYFNVKPARRPQSTSRPNRPNVQSFSSEGNQRPSYQQGSQFGGSRPNNQQGSQFGGSRPNNQQGSQFGGSRPNNQQGSQFGGSRPNQQGSQFESGRPDYQQGFSSETNNPNPRPGPQKRKRISEQKCEEYSKQITENITGLPLTTNPDPVTIPVRKCITPQQLIVGGENTTLGEFPHMAAIGFRDRNKKQIAWNCGGSLISDQFVMTAAHCTSTSSGRPVKVRLGEYNLMKNDDGAYPVDYVIVEIITHPDYKPPSKYNDIALLKLSRKVTFFKHIRPACLYSEDTFSATKAIATGWGRIYYDGSTSEILQKVVLSIVDNNTCNRLYKVNIKTEVLSRGIVDSQLCAGELTGGKDTCQGDSGGPLSITNTKCIHHVIGITSFGKSCALPNSTGVYTRVSAYVPWIESVIWPSHN